MTMQNREHWNEKINKYFPEYFADNLTDFNDSTCFTYWLGTDGCRFRMGSKDLNVYLAEGNTAYYAKLQISCKAPLFCLQFYKYEGSGTDPESQGRPFTDDGKAVYRAALNFAFEEHLKIKRRFILMKEMIGEQTAYEFYFEPALEA